MYTALPIFQVLISTCPTFDVKCMQCFYSSTSIDVSCFHASRHKLSELKPIDKFFVDADFVTICGYVCLTFVYLFSFIF